MKWIILSLAACLPILAQESPFTNGRLFRVEFDNIPQDSPNVAYYVLTSTNAALPLDQWQVHETFWQTNGAVVTSTNRFPAVLPMQLFVVSSSNEFGIAFSEPFVSAPPRAGQRIRLRSD